LLLLYRRWRLRARCAGRRRLLLLLLLHRSRPLRAGRDLALDRCRRLGGRRGSSGRWRGRPRGRGRRRYRSRRGGRRGGSCGWRRWRGWSCRRRSGLCGRLPLGIGLGVLLRLRLRHHHPLFRRGVAGMREQQQRRDDASGEQNGLAIHGMGSSVRAAVPSPRIRAVSGGTVEPRHGNFAVTGVGRRYHSTALPRCSAAPETLPR
jgi:hypothetical protein